MVWCGDYVSYFELLYLFIATLLQVYVFTKKNVLHYSHEFIVLGLIVAIDELNSSYFVLSVMGF